MNKNNNKRVNPSQPEVHSFFNNSHRNVMYHMLQFLKDDLNVVKLVNKPFNATVDEYTRYVAHQMYLTAKDKIAQFYRNNEQMKLVNAVILELGIKVPEKYLNRLSFMSISKSGKVGEVTIKAETLYDEEAPVIEEHVDLKKLLKALEKLVVKHEINRPKA